MKTHDTLRRMTENEAVFRKHNETIQKGFDELRRLGEEDDQQYMAIPDDSPLQFYCECSDENCKQRVELKPSRYEEIHKIRNHFVLLPGHDVGSVETIVDKFNDYIVV